MKDGLSMPVTRTDAHRSGNSLISEQFMEGNVVARALHLSYSPDFTPSDLCLFGCMNHCLRTSSFEATDQLLLASEVILIHRENRLGCFFSGTHGVTLHMHCSQC